MGYTVTGECVRALERFFSGFGLPVYREGNVPMRDGAGRDVKPPYITVQMIAPNWRGSMPIYARVWYRSDTSAAITAKVDEIEAALGEGAAIETEHGAVYLYRGDSFCQFQDQAGDRYLWCAYLNMTISNNTP